MTHFDLDLAYEAVKKDADVPPVNDTTTQYADREENVGYEARAGLTSYKKTGWVNNEEVSFSAPGCPCRPEVLI